MNVNRDLAYLADAVHRTLAKNAAKHPVEQSKGSAVKYTPRPYSTPREGKDRND